MNGAGSARDRAVANASVELPSSPADSDSVQVVELFDAHAAGLLRYLSSRLDRASAEDVVSETFLIALRDVWRYDPSRAEARVWLFGIATNVMRQQFRREARQVRLATLVPRAESSTDVEGTTIDRVDAQAAVHRLAGALDALTDGDREVLLLTALGELNATEVAEILDIPAGTVRSRLHRVRRQLLAASAADDQRRPPLAKPVELVTSGLVKPGKHVRSGKEEHRGVHNPA